MKIFAAGLAALILCGPVMAEPAWVLDAETSKVAYGSIKKDRIGEVNHFGTLAGTVDDTGLVRVEIDLASVETYVDIRNERMREHVFGATPVAVLTSQIDLEALEAMAPGDTAIVDVDGMLAFVSAEVEIYTEAFVARLADGKALVTTDGMIMLGTEELAIDGAIDTLMGLADLPGITRVAPVTFRLVFDKAG
ncbi:YceI family protein [Algicella marina]|uniref:YceI family protein n=1 Tax=Algicella marina TaxID=2683284 RepID=A0A6P1T2D1_9RHOB|nr:YceI family protein [Algicella marina]QHQ35469.1 YceI family protein [Algicella marina]